MPPTGPTTTGTGLKLDLAGEAASQGLPGSGTTFGGFLSSTIQIVMVISVLAVLLYFIWGAFEWITAAGDKGKVQKARDRMTNAAIGLVVLSGAIAIFMLLQQFLGVNVITIGGTSGSGTSGGGSRASCGPSTVGVSYNDGGAGGYCTGGGAAMVQCHAADGHLGYYHYDPCYCISGSEISGYDFSSC